MYRIIVNDVPPSNNKFIGRTNRWEYQKTKKEWLALIKHSITSKPVAPLRKSVVHLHYIFADKRRRDPDNYSGKMLLDALVDADMILDDSFRCIELKLSSEYRKGVKKTVIMITEQKTAEE